MSQLDLLLLFEHLSKEILVSKTTKIFFVRLDFINFVTWNSSIMFQQQLFSLLLGSALAS